MAGISSELREKIWDLHNQGYFDWQIAKELGISEATVVKILGK